MITIRQASGLVRWFPMVICAAALSAGEVIVTVAGGGTSRADGVSATLAALDIPFAVVADPSGNLYIADSQHFLVRKVEAGSGLIQSVAGNGASGWEGDGGPATAANLGWPQALAVAASGDLYIADPERIRRVVKATGIIETVAGNGATGFSGDDGPAVEATLSSPAGLVFDSGGRLLIADFENARIRRVDLATGLITTIAGSGNAAFAGDGGPATAAGLKPRALAIDTAGNLFVADPPNRRVRRIDGATGTITTVVGNGQSGAEGDGGPAIAASLSQPEGVAVDAAGNLFVLDTGVNAVRKVDGASGIISTVVGNFVEGFLGEGRSALLACLAYPAGIALDAGGNLLIADTFNHRIRKVGAGLVPQAPLDADTDGFMDVVETAAGTSSSEAGSTPFDGAPADVVAGAWSRKLSINLVFSTSGADSLSFLAGFEVPEGTSPAGQLILDVGGAVAVFHFDEAGKAAPAGANKARLKIKGTTATLKASLKNEDLATALADEHLIEEDIRGRSVAIAVRVYFSDTVFSSMKWLKYSARPGVAGSAKMQAHFVFGNGGIGLR